jgi:DNA-binding MarR family transcriptional regulator
MEGETGDAKCLTPSALAPPVAGLFLVRRGGLGKAVTELERKHLVETDRHIAECREYIAKQRERIERAIEQGRSMEVADIMLETFEISLRAFERQRRLLLDRLKERER